MPLPRLYVEFNQRALHLAKSGVLPKVAQTMARHSDINLTMNVYSHVNMEDPQAAIAVVLAPPTIGESKAKRRSSGI